MATYLYRLGRWAFEHRRRVLMIWLAVLVLIGGVAAAFSGRTSDKFSVPGTESQRAQDLFEQKYPGAGGAAARVVFAAPKGETLADPANRDGGAGIAGRRRSTPPRSTMVDLAVRGRDHHARTSASAFADVIYPVPADEIERRGP